MKKLKLQTLGLSVNDLLTREQMKKVMGGCGGSGGSGSVVCGVVRFNSGGTVVGGYYTPDGFSGNGTNGKSRDEAITEMNRGNNNPDVIYNGDYIRYCCDSCPQYI